MDYEWDVNAASNVLREQNLEEQLPPCPNCGQPSVVLYPPGPGMDQDGNPITTPGVLACSIKCYETSPEAYLAAVIPLDPVPIDTAEVPSRPTRPTRPIAAPETPAPEAPELAVESRGPAEA